MFNAVFESYTNPSVQIRTNARPFIIMILWCGIRSLFNKLNVIYVQKIVLYTFLQSEVF